MNSKAAHPQVVINIGTGKFFLHQTAELLASINLLDSVVSGLLGSKPSSPSVKLLGNNANWRRLQNRSSTLATMSNISQSYIGEIFYQLANICGKFKFGNKLKELCLYTSLLAFDFRARRHLKEASKRGANIYHFRAGFGGKSVANAKGLGMQTICDHSYPHPLFNWWDSTLRHTNKLPKYSVEQKILTDLDTADHVIVNSTFVADTFTNVGDMRHLTICTPPIDSRFTNVGNDTPFAKRSGVLFAGTCNFRKGIDRVGNIIENLEDDVSVVLAGNWDPDMFYIRSRIAERKNTSIKPHISFTELANLMSKNLVFLFPTRAEGSESVVGEALHNGCNVITTHEAGLPLNSNEGILINSRSAEDIAAEINRIHAEPKQYQVMSDAGRAAIKRIESEYYPTLITLYHSILIEQ